MSTRLGARRGPSHQERVLRRWSARTLVIHIANIEKFLAWVTEECGSVTHETFRVHGTVVELLVKYVLDLLDGGAAPTMPASRLASLKFLNRAAGLQPPLPADEVSVSHLALSHRREAPARERQPQIYTVAQVRAMERAATELPDPLHRIALRTELRKVYAALRNDDAIWDKFCDWTIAGTVEDGCLYGKAYKTKATEATATRLRGGMPWIAPLRGIQQPPSRWARGYKEDLQQLGIPDGAEFAVPSPQRIAAGATPGAAEPDEWLATIRRALRAASLPPHEARRIGLHAAKRTLLTWAGSSGIFGDRDIEVLGHHRCSGIGKVVCAYNVTVLAAPVTKLRQLLEYIVKGEFDPDAPAGMQWRAGAYPGLLPAGRPAPGPALLFAGTMPTVAGPLNATARPLADAPQSAAPLASAARHPSHCDAPAADEGDRAAPAAARSEPPSISPQHAAAIARAAAPPEPPRAHAPRPPPGPGPDRYGYITSTGQEGARRRYVHIAALVDASDARPGKIAVRCEHGTVTNLCDYRITSAVWDNSLGFADAVLCKVCKARARRPERGALGTRN